MARVSPDVAGLQEATALERQRDRRRHHPFGRLKVGALCGAALLLLSLVAMAAPLLAPHDPYAGDLVNRLKPPFWFPDGSTAYPLGTDGLGRDVLSRLIHGARVSLAVGALATVVSMALGVLLGLAAGYLEKAVDAAVSTSVNVMLTFPFILLALAVVAVLGNGVTKLILVLGVAGWPVYTRVVRAEVRRIKELDYVHAAHLLGSSDWRIVFRHILPNLLNAVIVLSSIQVARVIISEAFLSFLGLGVTPPTPTWGNMLGESRTFVYDRWWLPAFPGLMIFFTALAINLFGGGVQDYQDPHARNW